MLPTLRTNMLLPTATSTTTLVSRTTFPLLQNPSASILNITCVLPISGQYGPLQRWNYYALLLFALVVQKHKWLLAAAVATVMSFAGVTAIHALILAISFAHDPGVLDLDIVACWSILALTNMVAWLMIDWRWSKLVRDHRLKSLVRVWAVLISCGMLTVAVVMLAVKPTVQTCENFIDAKTWHQGNLATYVQSNCSLPCFNKNPLLRRQSEITVMDASGLDDNNAFFASGKVFSLYMGLIAAAYTIYISVFRRDGDDYDADALKEFFEDSFEPMLDRLFVPGHHWIWRILIALFGFIVVLPLCFFVPLLWALFFLARMLYQAFTPIFATAALVCNEAYLFHEPTLPVTEALFAIGQWGCWVATALALIAAFIDHRVSKPAVMGE